MANHKGIIAHCRLINNQWTASLQGDGRVRDVIEHVIGPTKETPVDADSAFTVSGVGFPLAPAAGLGELGRRHRAATTSRFFIAFSLPEQRPSRSHLGPLHFVKVSLSRPHLAHDRERSPEGRVSRVGISESIMTSMLLVSACAGVSFRSFAIAGKRSRS